MLTACLPFSQPLKTTGVWIIGFETNIFFEGPKPPAVEDMWDRTTGAELVVDEKIYKWVPKPEIEALQVDLVGRRSLCPVGAINPYPIAVQKLQIRRRLGSHP